MPRPTLSGRRYVPGLDGVRALAVLAVIAYHLNLSWAPGGMLGVGVFFTLSGYLITDLLLDHWERHTDLATIAEESDFDDLGLTGFAAHALADLSEAARCEGDDATAAQDALGMLYRFAAGGGR